ncbi:hypothetical protein FA13DRAFT_1717432 [Coprinellus micaceus]|uniref:Uncharacterized protein n=1 Tax=Coprinellus micaceus TaxID=71717 RepID=A0A4Y7SHX3_COPMI|nr:hypothetical protein FA13DRAFT_1717432 [Coprinellus micaceus]
MPNTVLRRLRAEVRRARVTDARDRETWTVGDDVDDGELIVHDGDERARENNQRGDGWRKRGRKGRDGGGLLYAFASKSHLPVQNALRMPVLCSRPPEGVPSSFPCSAQDIHTKSYREDSNFIDASLVDRPALLKTSTSIPSCSGSDEFNPLTALSEARRDKNPTTGATGIEHTLHCRCYMVKENAQTQQGRSDPGPDRPNWRRRMFGSIFENVRYTFSDGHDSFEGAKRLSIEEGEGDARWTSVARQRYRYGRVVTSRDHNKETKLRMPTRAGSPKEEEGR